MISIETLYKMHDKELLAIIEAFTTWHYYLDNCKYKVLVLADYDNLSQFMNTKNLSFW